MSASLADGWIVQVEPIGMHGEGLFKKTNKHLVLVCTEKRKTFPPLAAQKKKSFSIKVTFVVSPSCGNYLASGPSAG